MLSLSLPVRIFLCVLPTDMRRGFDLRTRPNALAELLPEEWLKAHPEARRRWSR